MQQPTPGTAHAGSVSREAKVTSFAAEIIAAGRPFAVTDGKGDLVGEVTPDVITCLLAGIVARKLG